MKQIQKKYRIFILLVAIVFLIGCKKENVPAITTTAVSILTDTTATSGGNITDEGSSTVINRGICWSTGTTPTLADNKTSDGAGAGSFSSRITGIYGGTVYYVRAYATNSIGTGYGMTMSFTTPGEPPSAPKVTLANATQVQLNTASINGTVNAKYYSTTVTFEYGVNDSYGQTITASQSPLTGGTNTNVSAYLTGLNVGTTYHFRIKAVNSLGTTYSNDVTFKTLGQSPTASTLAITRISTSGATLSGTVNANYVSSIVSFEYGFTTAYGNSITATQSPVTGSTSTNVSVSITGLILNTTYHYRVKAINSLGTTYGSDMTFKTAPTTVIDIDGNVYNVVAIGAQVWMAENLKTTKNNDDTPIPNVTENTSWGAVSTPAYCWYGNDIANKATYGALYNWYTVDVESNGNKNVCPTEWHVPSYAEWNTLSAYLGGESIGGGKLKEVGTLHWLTPNTGASNESGFTALPGGDRYYYAWAFDHIGSTGSWWTASKGTSFSSAWYASLFYDRNILGWGDGFKNLGFSIRCLRN